MSHNMRYIHLEKGMLFCASEGDRTTTTPSPKPTHGLVVSETPLPTILHFPLSLLGILIGV
jgi:hypothetical protein